MDVPSQSILEGRKYPSPANLCKILNVWIEANVMHETVFIYSKIFPLISVESLIGYRVYCTTRLDPILNLINPVDMFYAVC